VYAPPVELVDLFVERAMAKLENVDVEELHRTYDLLAYRGTTVLPRFDSTLFLPRLSVNGRVCSVVRCAVSPGPCMSRMCKEPVGA
jgi:hypothetical protein